MKTPVISQSKQAQDTDINCKLEGEPHSVTNKANSNEQLLKIPKSQVKANVAARRSFTASYKLKILSEYDACDNALARGALLRKEGLYSSRISTWRKELKAGRLGGSKSTTPPKEQITQLTKENSTLKIKLLQAEAIIELQKKVSDLFGLHIHHQESSGIV